MTLNQLAPATGDQAPPPTARSRKPVALAASAAAFVALGAGGWFAFMSPHDSTVKLVADTSTAVPGKPVTVTGTISPAVAHRVVELAVATTIGGPYAPAGTATTDASGRFQTTWTPAQAGKAWVQATAIELGRDQEAQSTAAAVTVRTPATLTLKLSAPAIRTTTAATVTATVAPAGGAVTLEKSSDGTTWMPLPTTAAKGGTATAKLSGLTGGTWHIRGAAAQTNAASEAASKEATLFVEDYKAAGAKYVAIVGPGNKAIGKLNNLIDAGASLASLKEQVAAVSAAMTQEGNAFRAYKGWPRAVAPVIEELAKASVVDADQYHLMSQVSSFDEWNQRNDETNSNTYAEGAAAARARDLLGLPKRSLNP
ncbi:hypothetical protein ABEG17_08360 [Pedococcus sp. KACC 23699]|uniref:Carboxypeptidase regulatory-like domain-containing protein n=1 Tax=Pedococcus sp. KACC 23699 TaxID=3149228 RepID=A0AAU7JXZ6_9MICO